MMYLTAKSRLTDEWLYFNEPVTNISIGEHCIECKVFSGKWELLNNLYCSVMLTNLPIRDVVKE